MFDTTIEPQFKIAVNTGVISRPGNKPDFGNGIPKEQRTEWQNKTRAELTYHMVNGEAPMHKIARFIRHGYTITAHHTGGERCKMPIEHKCWSKQHRCNANFLEAQHLGADFDNLKSEAELFDNPLVQQYGSIIYHTPSSYYNGNGPKMRVLFLLDQGVTEGKLNRNLILAMQWKFEGTPDPACTDYCRLFYGNLGCDPVVTGNVLPLATAKAWLVEYEQAHPVKSGSGSRLLTPGQELSQHERKRAKAFGDAILRRASDKIKSAMSGNRHYELKRQGYNVFCYVHGGVISEMDARQALEDAYRSHVANPLDLHDLLEWCYENTRDNPQGLPVENITSREEWWSAKGYRYAV